jgi:hypothetical protein
MTRGAEVREPERYAGAAEDADWRAAEEEMRALAENGTRDLVDSPAGELPIGCEWMYKVKYNSDGMINRHKARLVAKSYAQKHGTDFDETFAPVAKMMIVRVNYDSGCKGVASGTNTCRLKKSLYRLKQAHEHGTQELRNNCVSWALRRQKRTLQCSSGRLESDRLVFCYMIDDLVITGADCKETTRARSQLAASFGMKNLGDLHCFLRIQEIRTSPEGILMNQRHYALSMRFKFGMAEWKPIPTPLGRTVKLHPDSGRVCGPTRF